MLRDPADIAGAELPFEKKVARKRATAERKRQRDNDRRRLKLVPAEEQRIAPGRASLAGARQKQMIPDGAVLQAFMNDWNMVTIIRGPWRSGKSVGCVGKLFMAAGNQAPDAAGVRKTRWIVVRNTYPDLQQTTIKTWLNWFPENVYGAMVRSRPMSHTIRVPGPPDRGQATRIEMEVIFLALDDEDDRKKLLSLEYTGFWVNEGREIPRSIIDDLIGRTGCYPSDERGIYCSWAGGFIDTNAPGETHWIPLMMGETAIPDTMGDDERESLKMPDNWNYYVQPGALLEVKDRDGRVVGYEANPQAENIKYLPGGHKWYLDRVGGHSRTWVRVNFCNRLGQLVAGKAVWPTFERLKHVTSEPIAYNPELVLIVGIDTTGRHPAAVFLQPFRNRFRVLRELVAADINIESYAPLVKRDVARLGASVGLPIDKMTVTYYRDPHQEQNQIDGRTCDMIFRKNGIVLIPAPGGNGRKHRIETTETLIDQNRIDISPVCTTLIAGAEGAYHYRKLKVTGREEYDAQPAKNAPYADTCEALEYAVLGAGEGRSQTRGTDRPQPVKIATRYKPGENRTDLWAKRRARANA